MSSDVVIAGIMSFFGCLKVKVSKHMVVTNVHRLDISLHISLELLFLRDGKPYHVLIWGCINQIWNAGPSMSGWRMESSDDWPLHCSLWLRFFFICTGTSHFLIRKGNSWGSLNAVNIWCIANLYCAHANSTTNLKVRNLCIVFVCIQTNLINFLGEK